MTQLGHRVALEIICATTDINGQAVGHWHRIVIKIAQAALFGHIPLLSDKDWATIRRNLPEGHSWKGWDANIEPGQLAQDAFTAEVERQSRA